MTSRVRNRDGSCRLTDSIEETNVAHVISISEETWFVENEMIDYTHDIWIIDTFVNLLLLRKDIHHVYDHLKWTMTLKLFKWCCIYIDSAQEFVALYHNVEIWSLHDISFEYLLVDFANVIFYLLYSFLNNNVSKRLIEQSVETQESIDKKVSEIWCSKRFSIFESRNRITSSSKNRSSKRKYAQDNVSEFDENLFTCDDNLFTSTLHNSTSPLVFSRKRRKVFSTISFFDFHRSSVTMTSHYYFWEW